MMVLRHLSASATGVVGSCHNENTSEEERAPIPMDLSKSKSGRSGPPSDQIPLNLNKNTFAALSMQIRPLSSSSRSSENIINNNTLASNNNNNNDVSAKSRNIYKSESPVNFSTRSPTSHPPPQVSNVSTPHLNSHHHHHSHQRRSRKADLRWRELGLVHASTGDEDDNTFSSPDSGLHRDSPGEEDDVSSTKPLSPSSMWRSPSSTTGSMNNAASYLRKQSHPCLIPLSLIRAKYNHTNVSPERFSSWEEEQMAGDRSRSESCGGEGGDKVQTKRARLEEMVSQIKTTKDTRTRHYSGDDDTSSGGHVTSSDEVIDDGPTDLRHASTSFKSRDKGISMFLGRAKEKAGKVGLNLIKDTGDYDEDEEDGDEPCNLAYPKSSSPRPDGMDIAQWKKQAQLKSTSPFPLSPTDAAKLYGIDPDTYQQQIMQLQLTSAAMLGDPSGLLKALGQYPPWVYVGYYSQLLQSFQAQEILRQYAIQSTNQPNSQGEEKTSTDRGRSTVASSTNYHGHGQSSPLSPASVNEGAAGIDSDGSAVGPNTQSGLNGKRAPRAMTGRHVRTGTGASPSTLLTLRQKIEERQRVKAQQAILEETLLQTQGKGNKNGNSKYSRKPVKK